MLKELVPPYKPGNLREWVDYFIEIEYRYWRWFEILWLKTCQQGGILGVCYRHEQHQINQAKSKYIQTGKYHTNKNPINLHYYLNLYQEFIYFLYSFENVRTEVLI